MIFSFTFHIWAHPRIQSSKGGCRNNEGSVLCAGWCNIEEKMTAQCSDTLFSAHLMRKRCLSLTGQWRETRGYLPGTAIALDSKCRQTISLSAFVTLIIYIYLNRVWSIKIRTPMRPSTSRRRKLLHNCLNVWTVFWMTTPLPV